MHVVLQANRIDGFESGKLDKMLVGAHGHFLAMGLARGVRANVDDGRCAVEYGRLVGENRQQGASLGFLLYVTPEVGLAIGLKLALPFAWPECRAGTVSFQFGDVFPQS